MHSNPSLVIARVERFVRERVEPAIIADRVPLQIDAWEVPDEPVPFADALAASYAPFQPGTEWGKPWGTTWFRVRGEVPAGWRGRAGHTVEMSVDIGFNSGQAGFQAEGLAWRPDGSTIKAIEPYNAWVPVESDTIDVYIEAASNPDLGSDWSWRASPYGDKATAGTDPIYTLRHIDAVLRDGEVAALERDLFTLQGLYAVLPRETPRSAEVLRAMERCVDAVDPHDVAGTASAGRAELASVLASPANASAHRIAATGHAHIDSAWLWPTRETIRKCARTFSNVLALMDEHPDFVFACSSAQQYAWIRDFYPELFERIREKVTGGQFIPVGGMWVESDTNLPGGEALARQFVLGTGFFIDEFGFEPEDVWLPDSFGYSGALPQIARAAGKQYFLTQKLSWNETNTMPHHTFQWEGIDGTRVFTHFPPVDTYNSDLSQAELHRAERQYSENGDANTSLVPFGYGDGGGGPTREMLESAARSADLEGSPRVEVTSPSAFFRTAEQEYAKPPVWFGEMYLEFHRGTYTSQARTKQGNRRSEHLLREAELWATTAAVRAGAEYPYDTLRTQWEKVLLNQFHDILPGSSIAWVYQVAEEDYRQVSEALEQVIAAAFDALPAGAESRLANASPFPVAGVPALGTGASESAAQAAVTRTDDGAELSNAKVRVRFDSSGRIASLVEIATGREYVAPEGRAAELQLFRDTPTQWDAWDVDVHYRRHEHALTALDSFETSTGADGSAVVTIRRTFGDSSLTQTFSLRGDSPTVEIETDVDWHERQQLLKLSFDLDVSADRAASEIQFGHVHRAMHENTSWDAARFETSAHRWMHVSEPGSGVAIANDATYGHDAVRVQRVGGGSATRLRQSLLRAPLFPDPQADQGRHVLHSSITVGVGIEGAVAEGYRINLPLRSTTAVVEPLLRGSNPSVVVEAVKLAEDRSGDVIVRLYESAGARSAASVQFNFDVASIVETDLLEREVTAEPPSGEAGGALTAVEGATAQLSLRPFQIVTLRVARA